LLFLKKSKYVHRLDRVLQRVGSAEFEAPDVDAVIFLLCDNDASWYFTCEFIFFRV